MMMLAAAVLVVSSVANVQGDGLRLEFDDHMRSRVVATSPEEKVLGPFAESETLRTSKGDIAGFVFANRSEAAVADELGAGKRTTLTGRSGNISKQVEVTAYRERPHWLFMRVRYTNEGSEPVEVLGYTSNHYAFDRRRRKPPSRPSGPTRAARTKARPDWVAPGASRLRKARISSA